MLESKYVTESAAPANLPRMGVERVASVVSCGSISGFEQTSNSEQRTGSEPSKGASAETREAILADLYTERRAFIQKRRLEGLSGMESAYLGDIENYIDHWERQEQKSARPTAIWDELDRLATSVIEVAATIEQHRKR